MFVIICFVLFFIAWIAVLLHDVGSDDTLRISGIVVIFCLISTPITILVTYLTYSTETTVHEVRLVENKPIIYDGEDVINLEDEINATLNEGQKVKVTKPNSFLMWGIRNTTSYHAE